MFIKVNFILCLLNPLPIWVWHNHCTSILFHSMVYCSSLQFNVHLLKTNSLLIFTLNYLMWHINFHSMISQVQLCSKKLSLLFYIFAEIDCQVVEPLATFFYFLVNNTKFEESVLKSKNKICLMNYKKNRLLN